jgi:hypothetical protein
MEIVVEESPTKKYNKEFYAIFRSKKLMKRDKWIHIESYDLLEGVVKRLKTLNNIYDESYTKRHKYKIVHVQQISKHTAVCPKQLMVERIKHGI